MADNGTYLCSRKEVDLIRHLLRMFDGLYENAQSIVSEITGDVGGRSGMSEREITEFRERFLNG